jgi:hypothetical protein
VHAVILADTEFQKIGKGNWLKEKKSEGPGRTGAFWLAALVEARMGLPLGHSSKLTHTGIGYLDLTPTIYLDVGRGVERIDY